MYKIDLYFFLNSKDVYSVEARDVGLLKLRLSGNLL